MAENQANLQNIEAARDAMIAHAERCWRAECENAQRIADQKKLLSAAIVGLLGLGLFKVDWLMDGDHVSRLHCWPMDVAVKLLLIVAIYCFAAALYALYRLTDKDDEETPGQPRHYTASQAMAFQPGDGNRPMKKVVATRIYKAYLELQRRNARQWDKVKVGQGRFAWGFFLVLVALVLYLIGSSPPTIS